MEGIFAHYEESAFGRVVRVEVNVGHDPGEGLVAIYKDGSAFEVVAIDASGQLRMDWAEAVCRRPIQARPVAATSAAPSVWQGMIRRLGAQLDPSRRPYALAALVVRPQKT